MQDQITSVPPLPPSKHHIIEKKITGTFYEQNFWLFMC